MSTLTPPDLDHAHIGGYAAQLTDGEVDGDGEDTGVLPETTRIDLEYRLNE